MLKLTAIEQQQTPNPDDLENPSTELVETPVIVNPEAIALFSPVMNVPEDDPRGSMIVTTTGQNFAVTETVEEILELLDI